MSDEDERRYGVGDEDEIIREEESGGDEEIDEDDYEEIDEDDESDYNHENNGSEEIIREQEFGGDEEMDKDGESDYSSENNVGEVNVGVSVSPIEEDSIDRLSLLPDRLLIRILAGLNMKKAITTCVLSKRWKYLWTQLPRLRFIESSADIGKAYDLVSWVHRALILRSVNYLDELHIDFKYNKYFASDVNTWVEFAVRNKVKELRLELHSSLDFFDMLPQSMYSCSSLTLLSMKRCIVAPRVIVDWKCLTNLTIQGVELHEHAIQMILSGCPVLSGLDLVGCWGFERLEVNSQSLYKLQVFECKDGVTEHLLEISAPYVRSLSILHFPIGKKELRLTTIPSLIKATIHFYMVVPSHITEMEMDDAVRFFEDIKHVKELELSCQCPELLSKLAENDRQLPKSTREFLMVYSIRDERAVPAILLLASSPNLETLFVHSYDDYQQPDRTWDPIASDDLDCDLLRLKTVHLMDCADPYLYGEPMLTMAQILLKRATALEKMVVGSWGNLNDSCLEIVVQELLSYPRSSQKAVIDLLE